MNCLTQKKKLLMIFTSLCASLSTMLLVLSISTERWLRATELYKGNVTSLDIYPYNQTEVYVVTNFGLWRACTQYVDKFQRAYTATKCNYINYGNSGEMESEEEETVLRQIMKNSQRTTIFPLLGVSLEVIGDILCLLANCFGRKRYLMFVTGCLFVAAGMSLLVGCILFMGAVTGEANHQPQAAKDETPVFSYVYDISFIMVTLAFLLDEISGVLSVYLFIIRHKNSIKRRHAKLNAHRSKADRMNNYFRRLSLRNQSCSSAGGGEPSLRPSHMQTANCTMDRDISHMTMLTTIESHNNIADASVSDPLLDYHYDMISHPKSNGSCNPELENSGVALLTILPPDEFQSPDISSSNMCHAKNCATDQGYNCKITSV